MSSIEKPIAPKPKPAPSQPSASMPIFPAVIALAFVGTLVGAWVAQGSTKPPAPAPAAPGAAAEAAPAPTTPPSPPLAATVDDLKGLKGELDSLAKKVDAMAKPEPAVDLKPMSDKVDGLAKSIESTAALPKQIEDVAGKLAESEKATAALKTEIGTLKAEITALKDAAKAKPEPGPVPEPAKPAVDAAAMTAALDLFKANKFAEARDAFKKLPADDARVLYYTALANGFATATWTGETEQTVLKGVDREKAGSPARADIDAAFAGLTKAQGKEWLDSYRQKAK
ncbi:MAG: hypothetical protein JWN86_1442 [Planctomycetota bacterium]|nr:hypothetical protein [Planctomycetota bacterium]